MELRNSAAQVTLLFLNSSLISEILQRGAPYVVLVRDGNLEAIIDRMELASRIASTALQ